MRTLPCLDSAGHKLSEKWIDYLRTIDYYKPSLWGSRDGESTSQQGTRANFSQPSSRGGT